MYDFANSGYTTVVLTAVFNAYFVGVVAGGADWATLAWTATLSASSLVVMLLMPALGAYADRRGAKKRVLGWTTLACVASTALLAFSGPGTIALAVIAVVISSACFAIGESLVAAFLPELARPEAIGKVSGWGWSFGYLGGMLTLGLCLAYVLFSQSKGLPATHFVPVAMVLTAAVFALASIPTFVLLRERVPSVASTAEAADMSFSSSMSRAFQRLVLAWRQSREFEDFKRLLVCAVAYQAGISVVVALAAIYAEQALGFKQIDTMILIFLVNIAAALGAFAWGYVQDRIGHVRAIALTLVGWIVMTMLAGAATTPMLFWVAAVVAGLCMGSSQSAGRALAGALAPERQRGEFFGLWTFAIRLSSIIGPVTYGLVTLLTDGNHRLAIFGTGLFFVIGLVLLRAVDVQRGIAAAQAADAQAGAAAGAVQ
jgi:UMF1 family MFS transporter